MSQYIDSQNTKSALERLQLSRKPFPLQYILILYTKAKIEDVYINYFEGFKELIKWLGPIQEYDSIQPAPKFKKLPYHLYNYEIQELSKLLSCPPEYIFNVFLKEYTNEY